VFDKRYNGTTNKVIIAGGITRWNIQEH